MSCSDVAWHLFRQTLKKTLKNYCDKNLVWVTVCKKGILAQHSVMWLTHTRLEALQALLNCRLMPSIIESWNIKIMKSNQDWF